MTQTAVESAIRCSNLTKVYGSGETEVHALRGVDLTVRVGELLMLVGPSGCGKTTLISILAAVLEASGGEVEVLGRNLRALSDTAKTAFRSQAVGFVFQSFNLIPTLTAVENVSVPLLIRGTPRREAFARARGILERVQLTSRADALPAELSGGQQQRVAIARALVHGPQLVVCDEPTSALDHDTGQRIMEIFRSVVLDDRRTLVVVTHDARIFPFADRIARMDDGRIVEVRESAGSAVKE